jgi:hypothetical protein
MPEKRIRVTTVANLNHDPHPEKPFRRLAMAVILEAVKDFHAQHNFASNLDAALWLVEDAPLWMDAVGMEELDPVEYVTRGTTLKGRKIRPIGRPKCQK